MKKLKVEFFFNENHKLFFFEKYIFGRNKSIGTFCGLDREWYPSCNARSCLREL